MYFLSVLLIFVVLYLLEYALFSFIFMIFPVSSFIFLLVMVVLILFINPFIAYIMGELLIANKFI